jgi:UDP-N-acetyl-D-mannosaminuronic acid dehydrogenase
MRDLIQKIRARSLHLAVIGSGYVGLPTAALFADAGFLVTAVDTKPEIIEAVNSGISPIDEPGLEKLISCNVRAGRLKAVLNSAATLGQEDTVIISVQTPIGKNRKPDLSFLTKVVESIGDIVKKGTLVVTGSTVPPGTMLQTVKPKLESLSGLEADTGFYLAYAPERIAPGKALKEFVQGPRLVGGVGSNSTKITAELFRTVCNKVIETDASTAEVAKLAENTFRDVNVAFANQLALICEQLGVDVIDVIKMANSHPRVNIHAPGPGVGGPCLPKDPYLLLYPCKPTRYDMVEVARRINDSMPKHIVKLVLKAMKDIGKNIKDVRIAVLGTSYKGDVGDSRASPSKSVIGALMDLGAIVVVYDPQCKESFGALREHDLSKAVKDSDCLVIMVNHTEFRHIDLPEVKSLMHDKPVIIDGTRVLDFHQARKLDFIYYGPGSCLADN